MLKKIEKLAEDIVYYMDKKPKKNKSKTNKSAKISQNFVYYKLLPYAEESWLIFKKFLENFSNYSQRINFFLVWNSKNLDFIIWFNPSLEQKFKNNFYAFFPSCKLEKLNFQEPKLEGYIHSLWEETLTIVNSKNKILSQEIFSIFEDIPLNQNWILKCSIVINSTWNIEEYAGLFEILWRWIIAFFYWIYYFFYRLFTNKKPKIKSASRKQKVETWIKWTALSIWISGDKFSRNFFQLLQDNSKNELFQSSEEIFSTTKIDDFSHIMSVPNLKSGVKSLNFIDYKRLPPPLKLPSENEDITLLWTANWSNDQEIVWIKQEDKARHVYIMWKTWVWKSTLLSNMIFSDIENWRWLALIDPHGDLVDSILNVIPEHRKDDLVLFDVSNSDNVVGFNVFEKQDNENVDLLVSTILWIFKKLYGYSRWPRLEYILRNVLLTLTSYDQANFMHILKILTDKEFRKKVILHVEDSIVRDFRENEFWKRSERFMQEAISPITNKVWQFISSPIIRNIFCQKQSTISIKNIMQENKILLVNLSKWLIWEDNASMIWSFLVSWIQLETMKKAWISMQERKNFTLYIDEFQNFVTDSFTNILSEARKYNLSLVVANQYISQIQPEVQNAIFWNVWNLVCFTSSDLDASVMSRQFKNEVSVNDILSIPRFKAYSKIMIDWTSSDVFSLNTRILPDNLKQDKNFVKQIIENSNNKYTKNKEDVQNQINTIIWQKTTTPAQTEIEKTKINTTWEPSNSDFQQIYEWTVKLKFNYGLFVEAWPYEWLLHKKNINLPEWVQRKDYFIIWDKIKVRVLELKTLDGKTKAVREYV